MAEDELVRRLDTVMGILRIAHEAATARVPIHKWVKDATTLAQVAIFEEKLSAKQQSSPATQHTVTPRATTIKARRRSPEFGLDGVNVPAGVLSDRHYRDAEQMAKHVY